MAKSLPNRKTADDMKRWVEELAQLQASVSTGKYDLSIETILEEDREDRLCPDKDEVQ